MGDVRDTPLASLEREVAESTFGIAEVGEVGGSKLPQSAYG